MASSSSSSSSMGNRAPPHPNPHSFPRTQRPGNHSLCELSVTRAFLSLRSSLVPQRQKHSPIPLSAIATPPHASHAPPSSYARSMISRARIISDLKQFVPFLPLCLYMYLENSICTGNFRDMELREIVFALPPGFKFHPNDHELVCHYLARKVSDQERTMVEVDLHIQEPWELPDAAKLGADEWYFFSFRDRKYAIGSRTNRATKSGYWKATGKDREVNDPATGAAVGMRKTLVFYRGRAPNGSKTNWVMHEFRLETPRSPPKLEDWVLCRIFEKRKGEKDRARESVMEEETLTSSRWREEEWLGLLSEWETMENGVRF